MRLYVHWLDIEYRQLWAQRSPVPSVSQAEQLFKFHALFGNTIALSDVQVIDSPALIHLFAQDNFLRYLRDHPDFLELVAHVGSQVPSRAAVARSGLLRAMAPEWISSTFNNANVTRTLASAILESGVTDPKEILSRPPLSRLLIGPYREHRGKLEAIAKAVHHFSTNGEWRVSPPGLVSRSYYDELLDAAELPNLTAHHRARVELTLEFVDRHLEREQRTYRSAVTRCLEELDRGEERETVLHTMTNAWNCAVQTTLAPDGGSIAPLPYGVPLEIYRNDPVDALFPKNPQQESPLGRWRSRVAGTLDWDPTALSWERLRMAANETNETRTAYQEAIERRDTAKIESTLGEHARALAEALRSDPKKPIPEPLWYITQGASLLFTTDKTYAIAVVLGRAYYESVFAITRAVSNFRIANTLKATAAKTRLMAPDSGTLTAGQ